MRCAGRGLGSKSRHAGGCAIHREMNSISSRPENLSQKPCFVPRQRTTTEPSLESCDRAKAHRLWRAAGLCNINPIPEWRHKTMKVNTYLNFGGNCAEALRSCRQSSDTCLLSSSCASIRGLD